MAQNNRELAKKSLDLKGAPNRFVDKQDKELNAIQSQMDMLLEGAGDVEAAFLKKAPHERDAYDLAFAKLNPESARKADKYWKLAQKKLKVENEKVNLESARDLMNQIYSEQLNNINNSYDALNRASGVRNNITLNAAQSATGGLGANAVANAALRAQASNQIAKEALDIESQRQRDLGQAAAAQMQTPAILSQIGTANANIDLARQAASQTSGGGSGGGGGGGGRRTRRGASSTPATGGKSTQEQTPETKSQELTPDQLAKLKAAATKKGLELVQSSDGKYVFVGDNKTQVLNQADIDEILSTGEAVSPSEEMATSPDTVVIEKKKEKAPARLNPITDPEEIYRLEREHPMLKPATQLYRVFDTIYNKGNEFIRKNVLSDTVKKRIHDENARMLEEEDKKRRKPETKPRVEVYGPLGTRIDNKEVSTTGPITGRAKPILTNPSGNPARNIITGRSKIIKPTPNIKMFN